MEKRLTSFFVYNFMLALVIEGYLELLLSALIKIKAYSEEERSTEELFSISGEIVGCISAYLTLVILY